MQLQIAGETFSYIDQDDNTERLIHDIRAKLEQSRLNISYIIADGKAVYEDWEQFLLDHADTLQEISVIAVTLKTLITENLTSAHEYVNRAIPEVEALSSKFYQGPTPEVWDTFAELSEGIDWIVQLFTTVGENLHLSQRWDRIPVLHLELNAALLSLQEAMNNEDVVLIADVLKYEIKAFLEQLQAELLEILSEEDTAHDIV